MTRQAEAGAGRWKAGAEPGTGSAGLLGVKVAPRLREGRDEEEGAMKKRAR